jgi:hypothetical protein
MSCARPTRFYQLDAGGIMPVRSVDKEPVGDGAAGL